MRNRRSEESMCLKAKPIGEIPEETRRIGQQLLAEDNLYRIIGEQYAEIVKDEEFAQLYSPTGQPAYSPARLSLILVLQAMEHLSDRATAQMVRTRIDWKYALHLPLPDQGLDASVLSEFRGRLEAAKAERKFFDALLEKFKEKGWLKGRGLQRTDSLRILAAVRQLNRLELVMETLRLALERLVKVDVDWVNQHVPEAWFETYGEWIESERLVKESGTKGQAETERLLKQTGQDGFELLEKLAASPHSRQWRELEAIKTLAQVWQQQYRQVEKEAGVITIEMSTKESRQKEAGGGELICTPHNVQARYGEQSGVGVTGYKLHLTEVADEQAPAVITDVEVVGAQEYDGAAVEAIQQRLQERDLLPAEQVVDGGYVSGEIIVSSAQRGVKLIGPVQDAPGGGDQATASDHGDSCQSSGSETPLVSGTCQSLDRFSFDFEVNRAVCPAGQGASRWRETIRRDRGLSPEGQLAVLIYWPKQTCLGCPLALPSLIKQERGRIVQVSPFYPALQQRRQEQKQAAFKETYRRRSGIEASLSELVRGHQGRRTPYRGQAKTRLHYLRLASAMNLKRVIAWQQGVRPKRQREVRMKKLLGLKPTTRQGWNRRVA